MSLIGSGLSLTHRCTIQRIAESEGDGWGNPNSGEWEDHLTDQRCRSWATGGDEAIIDGATVTPVKNVHLLLPLGTDVTVRDRVETVTYRGGTVQDGPLGIRAVLTHKDHIELLLVEVA